MNWPWDEAPCPITSAAKMASTSTRNMSHKGIKDIPHGASKRTMAQKKEYTRMEENDQVAEMQKLGKMVPQQNPGAPPTRAEEV